MKAKEVRDLSIDQLKTLVKDLDKERFELKNEMAMTRKLEKPHVLKEKRRLKARAKTILSEKMKAAK
jgi:large subunit ribosomal protein L29